MVGAANLMFLMAFRTGRSSYLSVRYQAGVAPKMQSV